MNTDLYKTIRVFLTLIACGYVFAVGATKRLTLNVYAGNSDRFDCVVSADISQLKSAGKGVVLYEKNGANQVEIPSQLVIRDKKATLYWILAGKTPSGTTRTFVVENKTPKTAADCIMDVEDTRQALILKKAGKPALQYNYARVEPPAGVDSVFGRSGFIHPAYSPNGAVLTSIQPPDHRHHYGIWNPWTHIIYNGQRYDLWNLGEKQGTVRAGNIENTDSGAVFAGFTAALDHCIFTPEGEQTIIREKWNLKIWNVPDGFLWDFESHLQPATGLPVLIEAYRYAGFGWRGTPEWTKDNSLMMTSEGKSRPEIDGTTARWIYITGDAKAGRAGLLFMCHTQNRSFPEPLRIWDQNANGGRGDTFINFAPTKNRDWELNPDGHYILRYRTLTYEGEMTPEQANRLWNDFAAPPTVSVENTDF